MKLDGLNVRWSGYSQREKWTIAGVGVLPCVAAAGPGNRDEQRPRRGGAGSQAAGGGYASEEPNEVQQYSGSGYPAAFEQNLRDESTVRDTGTAEIVTGVSNPAADAAVDSGAATVVPTSELPVSSDPGE